MSGLLVAGTGILFMKVGTHAKESLEDIVARKTKEIDDAGFAMWGYGGNTCHPRTMVQPFAEEFERRGAPVVLAMEPMESKHFAEPIRAEQYSADGMKWFDIPHAINVVGSRFALVIEELRAETHVLPLDQTRVAIGNCRGRIGSRYVQGRVDKACLEVLEEPERSNDPVVAKKTTIGLVARLRAPYAVFLRQKEG